MERPPLRVLIVDDEALARGRLRELLQPRDDFEIVGECRNGADAVAAIRRHRPDLVLLDVQMPEMDGFGVLEALTPAERPRVIFVTAYDQYALRAFDLHAVDYLLKPFDDERFEQAVGRAQAQLRHGTIEGISHRLLTLLRDLSSQPAAPPAEPEPAPTTASQTFPERGDRLDRLAVRAGNRWHVVDVQDIDWIEGAGVYARLVVGDRMHLLRTSLTELERRLDGRRFVRIHRSTIVNIGRVKEIRPLSHGEFVLVLGDGTKLKVSRSYSDNVRAFLDKIT